MLTENNPGSLKITHFSTCDVRPILLMAYLECESAWGDRKGGAYGRVSLCQSPRTDVQPFLLERGQADEVPSKNNPLVLLKVTAETGSEQFTMTS